VPVGNDHVMNAKQIKRALTRIAHEILEHNGGAESIAIVGILTRGAHLAKRIANQVNELENCEVPVGLMDIGLYRDDVHSKLSQPPAQRTDILFSVKDKNIILVDDVLFTGRTIRAALNHITDFGRPKTIQLAVLVDRGHRELPIKADYVGLNIPTAFGDEVVLEVEEKEGQDQVYVIRNPQGEADPANDRKTTKAKKGGKQ